MSIAHDVLFCFFERDLDMVPLVQAEEEMERRLAAVAGRGGGEDLVGMLDLLKASVNKVKDRICKAARQASQVAHNWYEGVRHQIDEKAAVLLGGAEHKDLTDEQLLELVKTKLTSVREETHKWKKIYEDSKRLLEFADSAKPHLRSRKWESVPFLEQRR